MNNNKDNGYPHDSRADKNPYPHDGRAYSLSPILMCRSGDGKQKN